MNCACIYVDVEQYTNVFAQGLVKSRSRRVCDECGREIHLWEKYESFVGDDNGEIFFHATCVDCLSLRNEFFCDGYCWGQVLVNLSEHVQEMNGELSADCFKGLTSGAQEIVFQMIEDVWKELNEDEEEEEEELEEAP